MENHVPDHLVVQDVAVRYTYGGRLFRLTFNFHEDGFPPPPPCDPDRPWAKSIYFDREEAAIAREALGQTNLVLTPPDRPGPDLPPGVEIEELPMDPGSPPRPVGPRTLCWHHCGCVWMCLTTEGGESPEG